MELEFGHVGFWGEMKTARISREKERTRQTTTNSTNKVRRTRDSNPCHNRWSWEPSHQIERTSLQSHCHVTISTNRVPANMTNTNEKKQQQQKKQTNKWHARLSCAYLSSIVRQCKRTCQWRRLLRSSNLLQSLLTWLHTFPLCWWRVVFYFSPTG